MTFLIALGAFALNLLCVFAAFAGGVWITVSRSAKKEAPEKTVPELSPEEKARREVERQEIANFYAYDGDEQKDPSNNI